MTCYKWEIHDSEPEVNLSTADVTCNATGQGTAIEKTSKQLTN